MPRPKSLKKSPTPKLAATNGTAEQEKRPPVDLAALFRRPTTVLKVPDFRSDEMEDSGIRIEVSAFRSEESTQILMEYHEKVQQAEDEDAKKALLNEGVIAQLVLLTKRWWHEGESGDGLYYNGTLLPCTPENKRMIYTTDGWEWLRNFVVVGFMERANFFGELPKTA